MDRPEIYFYRESGEIVREEKEIYAYRESGDLEEKESLRLEAEDGEIIKTAELIMLDAPEKEVFEEIERSLHDNAKGLATDKVVRTLGRKSGETTAATEETLGATGKEIEESQGETLWRTARSLIKDKIDGVMIRARFFVAAEKDKRLGRVTFKVSAENAQRTLDGNAGKSEIAAENELVLRHEKEEKNLVRHGDMPLGLKELDLNLIVAADKGLRKIEFEKYLESPKYKILEMIKIIREVIGAFKPLLEREKNEQYREENDCGIFGGTFFAEVNRRIFSVFTKVAYLVSDMPDKAAEKKNGKIREDKPEVSAEKTKGEILPDNPVNKPEVSAEKKEGEILPDNPVNKLENTEQEIREQEKERKMEIKSLEAFVYAPLKMLEKMRMEVLTFKDRLLSFATVGGIVAGRTLKLKLRYDYEMFFYEAVKRLVNVTNGENSDRRLIVSAASKKLTNNFVSGIITEVTARLEFGDRFALLKNIAERIIEKALLVVEREAEKLLYEPPKGLSADRNESLFSERDRQLYVERTPEAMRMYKRGWFMRATAPTDLIIIPNIDYNYSLDPANVEGYYRDWDVYYWHFDELKTTIEAHPVPEGAELGTDRTYVSIEIMIDMLNMVLMLWAKFYAAFQGWHGVGCIKGLMIVLYNWLTLETSIEEMEAKGSYEDYMRCYRWLRWEAEAMIHRAREDYSIGGNGWIELYLAELFRYFYKHHFDTVPLFKLIVHMDLMRDVLRDPQGNIDIVLDKVKGMRFYDIAGERQEENFTLYKEPPPEPKVKEIQTFVEYLDFFISTRDDYTVFFSVFDEATQSLTSGLRQKLNKLGFRTIFVGKYRYGFVGIWQDGKAIYEEMSATDRITNGGTLPNGVTYTVVSAGYNVGSDSKIIIGGADYSLKRRGFNIVVYNNIRGNVIDSVNWDTHAEPGLIANR